MRAVHSAAVILFFAGSASLGVGQSPSLRVGGGPSSFADMAEVKVEAVPEKVRPGGEVTIHLTVTPKPGAWTYPVNVPKGQLSKNTIAAPQSDDVFFLKPFKVTDPPGAVEKPSNGDVDLVYKIGATWEIRGVVSPKATPGKKTVFLKDTRLQACIDGTCFPLSKPLTVEVEVSGTAVPVPPEYVVLVGETAVPVPAPPRSAPEPAPTPPPAASTGSPKKAAVPLDQYTAALDDLRAKLDFAGTTPIVAVDSSGSRLKGLLLAAAFWGFVSLVTPCVFPMIPITVSLFLKQSHQSPAQVLKLAAVYCLTIIAVLGASAVLLLSVFRKLSVDPYMNIFLGGLFVFFALSLFGMYDIALPGFLLRYTEKRRGAGGLVGTVFGALAFSIVSFTCVAPFLGGFAGLAASGNFAEWELYLAGVTFAAAFASPFFVLALFPSLLKKLPKSGGWLDTVKAVMGFLELAAAFKFFRTAELGLTDPTQYFTYDVVLAGWVAIAATTGLYLLNQFRLPHDEEKPNVGVLRMMFALNFLGFAVYLAPAMLKTGPNGEGQRPGGVVYAWVDAFLLPDGEIWSADLPGTAAKMSQEKASGSTPDKPLIFVDFTGETCTNCRYNEKSVFPLPEVRDLMGRYTLVAMYTDWVPAKLYTNPPSKSLRGEEGQANLQFQKAAFGDERLPLYAILDPQADGRVKVVGVYPESKINDVPAFVEFLKQPLGEK